MADVAIGSSTSSTVSTVLALEPASVKQARDIVRRALTRWRADAIADDVVLVASELVSNAVMHGMDGTDGAGRRGTARRVEFDLVATGSHVVCTVSDPSPEPPVRRDSVGAVGAGEPGELDDLALGGRGLQLIEALSMCWGWTPGGSDGADRGKSVWAVFPIADAGPRAVRPVALRAG